MIEIKYDKTTLPEDNEKVRFHVFAEDATFEGYYDADEEMFWKTDSDFWWAWQVDLWEPII